MFHEIGIRPKHPGPSNAYPIPSNPAYAVVSFWGDRWDEITGEDLALPLSRTSRRIDWDMVGTDVRAGIED